MSATSHHIVQIEPELGSINCIAALGNEFAFVGTSSGTLLKYPLRTTDASPQPQQRQQQQHDNSDVVEAKTTTSHVSVSAHVGVPNEPHTCPVARVVVEANHAVQQILVLHELAVLIVLCNGILRIHQTSDLHRSAFVHLSGSPTVLCFTSCTIFMGSDPELELSSYRLAIASKRDLFLYSLDPSVGMYRQFRLPEPPTSLEWHSSHIVLSFRRSYSVLHAKKGTPNELFRPQPTPHRLCVKLLPTEEFMLSTQSGVVFRGCTSTAVHKHITWADKSLDMACCFPYVVTVAPQCVHVCHLYKPDVHHVIADLEGRHIVQTGRTVLIATRFGVHRLQLEDHQAYVHDDTLTQALEAYPDVDPLSHLLRDLLL